MSTDPAAVVRHAQGAHDTIAKILGAGGILRCSECGTKRSLGVDGIARYLRDGWPVCCGYTMTWVTRRELDEEKQKGGR